MKVWEIGSGRCQATRGSLDNGHYDSVTCLELVPLGVVPDQDAYIVSGGADGNVMYWTASSAEQLVCVFEGASVTAVKLFRDTLGGLWNADVLLSFLLYDILSHV